MEETTPKGGSPFRVFGAKKMITIEGKTKTRVSATNAAEILGLDTSTLCVMRKQGRGPKYYKFGARYFYNLADLNDWIESCAVDPEGTA